MNDLQAEIITMLDSHYAEAKQARMVSVNIEQLSLLIQRAFMNKVGDDLKSRIANHPLLDSTMTSIAKNN